MPLSAIDDFLKRESAAGLILMAAAACAIAVANSPLGGVYAQLLNLPIVVSVGDFAIAKPLVLWVNDGLMAVFFFLIGLEVKHELVEGDLSSVQKAMLPVLAAVGGMAGPALIYIFITAGDAEALRGWAVPAATDIAFALGIMALLGSRVPVALKVFLTALAIIDDIGAIVIIAIFYTAQLSAVALVVAATCIAALVILNVRGVRRTDLYVGIGIVLWVAVLKSGVHATLAGVITALAIPIKQDADGFSPLNHLQERLHPWVVFFILPLFAFMNAGVKLAGISLAAFGAPVTLGIAAGLFIGKQVGVMMLTALGRVCGVGLPSGVSWLQLYGAAVLTGVGFTMSLFIGDLAFAGADQRDQVKLGVLAGSVLSGLAGYLVLRIAPIKH